MNYFIDPSVFYWINVFEGARTFCGVLGGLVIAGAISFIVGVVYNKCQIIYYENRHDDNKKYLKLCAKGAWICGIIGVFLTLGCVFLPGKETGIQMLVAKTATFDNINWSVAQVKEVIDYIVTAIKTI